MADVSAWEAVSNHGHGTWAVASVAMRYGVNKFVMMRGRGPGESDDAKIVLTGLPPGEKLYEEVPDDDEHSLTTPTRNCGSRAQRRERLGGLLVWLGGASPDEDQEVRTALNDWIPDCSSPVVAGREGAESPYSA